VARQAVVPAVGTVGEEGDALSEKGVGRKLRADTGGEGAEAVGIAKSILGVDPFGRAVEANVEKKSRVRKRRRLRLRHPKLERINEVARAEFPLNDKRGRFIG
jgi:hypothetical protein